jgi:hypothetical protein
MFHCYFPHVLEKLDPISSSNEIRVRNSRHGDASRDELREKNEYHAPSQIRKSDIALFPERIRGILFKDRRGLLTRILHDGWRHAISAASEPARRAGSARPRISSPRKQFAFSVMSGVDPEEPLWQRPERPFRPFGRIFREKCGLMARRGMGVPQVVRRNVPKWPNDLNGPDM